MFISCLPVFPSLFFLHSYSGVPCKKEADGEKESQKDLQDKLKFRDFGEVATYWMYIKFSFDRKHIIKSINKSLISPHMPLSEIHLCTNNYSSFVM